jgi:hypothetical protein
MITEVFLMFIISSVVGVISGLTHAVYKSKCRHVLCCCLEIDRDTDLEVEIEEMKMNKPDHHKKKHDK